VATIGYSVGSNWGSGFIGNMTVPGGSNGLHGWTLEFDAGFDITNIWNAVIVSHVGNHYVIGNADWNANVAAGGQASFGFQATTSGGNTAAGNLVLDNPSAPPHQVPPTLSVGDASFAEGSAAAPGHGAFTVTLSAASSSPVTVHYATQDGTAQAGSDYVAQEGTLTFAAGETQKTITVAAIGDGTVEADETFGVQLSSPTGATLARASATGTIVNDDTAPLPVLSIADTSIVEGNPGAGGPGWFSTSGNQIVDGAGHSVQIAGVNWFGFESSTLAPHGLWARGYKDMMNQMVQLGFNTIRLPFSSDTLHSTAAPNGIDFSRNPDLQGLSALQIMDKIVAYAGQVGLRVILDHHRSDSGPGTSPNGLWYDAQHSDAQWVADWQMLAERYAGNPTVIGADLHNEPYNGNWGSGGPNDWAAAAERAGNAIGAVNPNWLIFVEGIGTYQGQSYWWGGNLMGVKDRPIQLDVANKFVYSAHDYPDSVYAQPWFQGDNFAAGLPAKFDQMWGYIYKQGIAPVYLGEFGTNLVDPKDTPWFQAITRYLGGDFNNDGTKDIPGGQQGISWTYWSWNPNSGDTGGILADDWQTVKQAKVDTLKPIEFDLGSAAGAQPHADFVVTLSAPATETVTVTWATVPGTAGATDFQSANGTLTFAPGEQRKTISIAITPDTVKEGNEQFSVVLKSPVGATIGRATAIATIIDDDSTPALPTLAIADASFHEGTTSAPGRGSFTVSLSAAASSPVSVRYATQDGTAIAGRNYVAQSGSLTFAAGETQKTITIAAIDDLAATPNQSFSLVLSAPSGATLAHGSATGTIIIDDAAPLPSNGLHSELAVVDSWNSGFNANVSLRNDAAAATNGWQIAIDMPNQIGDIWNARIISHTGTHYVIGNADWNGQIAHNAATSFGFVASGALDLAAIHIEESNPPAPPGGSTPTPVTPTTWDLSAMFSPYIDMAMPADADLPAISRASGIEHFTLAFMLASDHGIGWQGVGGITDDVLSNGSTILQQVQAVQSAGGHVTISFGGAAGQEAALTASSASQLQAEYQSVIDRYHLDTIDFDIEGAAEFNQASLALRDQAIVGLQAANPGLKVSLTLPVLPTGLDAAGLNVLKTAKQDGVRLDVVNIMTMDYGASVDNGGQMGLDAINAIKATEQQLAALGLDAKIGATPMIGVNDIASEVFTQTDARALVDYAKTDSRVALLSMWSVARDNGNSAGAHYASSDSSGIAQTPFEFSGVFHQFDHK